MEVIKAALKVKKGGIKPPKYLEYIILIFLQYHILYQKTKLSFNSRMFIN